MENPYQGQNAVIYARFSCHSQTEQSIEGQLLDAYAFAEKNGIKVIGEYIDRAISGRKDTRPDFIRMIQDSAKRQFSLVLVWKLDRFSRDMYDSAVYGKMLEDNGVTVVSVTEPISNDPVGHMLRGILNSLNEYYSEELSMKILRGQRVCRDKGWFPGGTIPFGYVNQDHKLVPDERTAPIVREIFDRYTSGEGTQSIVDDLQARGIRNHFGRLMSLNGVSKLLQSPTYIGEYHHAGILVPDCATPLIDKKVFYKAIQIREQNKRAPAASRTPGVRYPLLGKLYCGECGERMMGDGGRGRHGGYYYYYTCTGKKKLKNGCKLKSIPKAEIEYAICKIIADCILNKKRKTIAALADYIMDATDTEACFSEADALEARLRQLDRDLDKLIDSIMHMPESVRPKIASRMEDVENQRRETEIELSRKRLEEAARYTREDVCKYFTINIHAVESDQGRGMIIEKFLNCAYIYDDGRIVIYLNQFKGLKDVYRKAEDGPGKDSYKEGTVLLKDPVPVELTNIPDFKAPPEKGSALYHYSPPYADKDEPQLPHLFFLHGRIGMVVWRQDIR